MPGGLFVTRLFHALVLALAAVTFFTVPLGKRTPFEHVLAVGRTPAAREATAALAAALEDARARFWRALSSPAAAGAPR